MCAIISNVKWKWETFASKLYIYPSFLFLVSETVAKIFQTKFWKVKNFVKVWNQILGQVLIYDIYFKISSDLVIILYGQNGTFIDLTSTNNTEIP